MERGELFLTSKADGSVRTAQGVAESVTRTLDALRTEYADLYLVHSPIGSFDDVRLSRCEFAYNVEAYIFEAFCDL